MIIASIMTGTSADGVDVSIRDFKLKKRLGFFSFDFSEEEKSYIRSFIWPNNKTMAEISEFNFKFSDIVGKYFMNISSDIYKKIDYVVYHGQTTFHDPNLEFSNFSSTMQLGNGAYLCNKIKKNVICDVRSADVSVGGQGAPLVIYGDKELFWDGKTQTLIFNIGGISNVSIIQKSGEMKAYDLGMGNALLDALMMKWFNKSFDKNGEVAKKGNIVDELLLKLSKHDSFLQTLPPKSTGKEKYNIEWLKELNIDLYKKEDVIRTITKHIAITIASVKLIENLNDNTVYILAGGGAYNPVLLNDIKTELKTVKLSTGYGVDILEREAAAFATLGYYYLTDKKIGSTTGAKIETIPGALYKYKRTNY